MREENAQSGGHCWRRKSFSFKDFEKSVIGAPLTTIAE
jgi:hypothetical protein